MKLRFRHVSLSIMSLVLLVATAWAVDPAALRNKQDAQQRARLMTKELITNVLDIQIQQLEENGLEEMTLFKDIKSMRGNIDVLVEAQMSQVVEVLTKAQPTNPVSEGGLGGADRACGTGGVASGCAGRRSRRRLGR